LFYYNYKNKKIMKKVEQNSTVVVNYTGKLEDGSVFDTSLVEGREPLKATLGNNELISGFENGLIGMGIGETKTIEIDPENAYGEVLDHLIQEVDKTQMPGEVEVGTALQANTQMGPVNFVVKEVKEETVVLDANHPLAGQKLIFELEVVGVE
jgi:FKBP-type peptidyl-prolyl cis-trans isomerase SlpA